MAELWEPTLTQVAGYVPWLTVSRSDPGAQSWLGTFSEDTTPNAVQAGQHITDAASLVAPRIGTIAATLYPTAATVTALLAAASLARAYRRGPEDLTTAAALENRATALLDSLVDSADDLPGSPNPLVPVLYAPDPVPWGDCLL